jgi:thiol-disulfide isomerase/thioredoxin
MTGEAYQGEPPRTWVGYRGDYTILGVPPGPVVVTVHARGYAPDLRLDSVSAGNTTTVDFALRPGGTLSGTVKDDKGQPVARAYVEATQWRGYATLGLRAVADAQGSFTIEDIPADRFDVTAMAPGCGQPPTTITVDPSKPVEIVLPPTESPTTAKRHVPQVGEPAPDVTFTTLAGETLTLSALKGKTVLLDFWATWCPPCIEEMPHLITLHERFGSRDDFVMIGVSRDHDQRTLRRYLTRNKGVTWHQVVGEAGGVETARRQYNVHGVPQVFLIGPEGMILATNLRGEEIVKRVEQALTGNGEEQPAP